MFNKPLPTSGCFRVSS